MPSQVLAFFNALISGDVFTVLQSLRAFFRWLFVDIVARHFGAVLFCGLIALIMSGAVGGSLGIDNLFQDSQRLVEIISTNAPLAVRNSPSLLTSLFLFYTAFLVIFFSRMSFKIALTPPQPGSRGVWGLIQRFIFWSTLLYLGFLYLWLFVGRGILDDCNPDPLQADCARKLKSGELARIFYGSVAGVLFSFLSLYGARLLRLGLGWVISFLDFMVRFVGFLISLQVVQRRLGVFGAATINQARVQLQIILKRVRNNQRLIEYFFYVLPTVVLLWFVLTWPKIIPAVALFTVLLLGFIFLRVFFSVPVWLRYGIAALLGVGLIVPDHDRFKLTFDGIVNANGVNAYEAPLDLRQASATANKFAHGANGKALEIVCTSPHEAFEPVDPLAALKAWQVRQIRQYSRLNPKLVIVASSGGAYRSAFWTALVLDRLSARSGLGESLEGLDSSIRVITGASGGMIGAAYFTSLAKPFGIQHPETQYWKNYESHATFLTQRFFPTANSGQKQIWEAIEEDVRLSQTLLDGEGADNVYRTRYPIPRDTLSPVAQHLLQKDLATIFRPERVVLDRGKVLERQWLKLGKSFRELRNGEQMGWRPSMIFSPMIVETGQPLIISNLDLSFMPRLDSGEAQSFFKMFPCSQGSFQLATAARMSATFPFLTPAVSLPTVPERRIVDAGYYDNYGVSLATAYLSDPEISAWIQKNTSGVLILQLRAFPLKTKGETLCLPLDPEIDPGPLEGVEWLSSPLEAALAARSASMAFRNEQELRAVIAKYAKETKRNEFIQTVIFANSAKVSMNWTLPDDEAEAMRTCLDHQWSEKFDDLKSMWAHKVVPG